MRAITALFVHSPTPREPGPLPRCYVTGQILADVLKSADSRRDEEAGISAQLSQCRVLLSRAWTLMDRRRTHS
jgi:hypothetical protein